MGDAAAANRSLSTIRTELEYLRESGMLRPEQYESITNQLPVRPTHTHTHIDTSIHSPPPSAPKFLHLTHSGRNRKAAVSQAPTSTHASPKGPTTSTCRSSRRQPRTPGIPPTRSIPRWVRIQSPLTSARTCGLWCWWSDAKRTAWCLGQEAGREARERGHLRRWSDGRVGFGEFDYLSGVSFGGGEWTGLCLFVCVCVCARLWQIHIYLAHILVDCQIFLAKQQNCSCFLLQWYNWSLTTFTIRICAERELSHLSRNSLRHNKSYCTIFSCVAVNRIFCIMFLFVPIFLCFPRSKI